MREAGRGRPASAGEQLLIVNVNAWAARRGLISSREGVAVLSAPCTSAASVALGSANSCAASLFQASILHRTSDHD